MIWTGLLVALGVSYIWSAIPRRARPPKFSPSHAITRGNNERSAP